MKKPLIETEAWKKIMDKKEWQEKSLDEIVDEFNQKHPNCNWEGTLKITKEDLQDYQKPF